MRDRRRNYEFVFVINPLHAGEEDSQKVIQHIQQFIESQDGEVTQINYNAPWGRRRLAYPIRAYVGGEASRRNFSEGFYVLMYFSLMASKIAELERVLKLTDTILRHLITLVDEPKGSITIPDLSDFEDETVNNDNAEDKYIDDEDTEEVAEEMIKE